MSLSEIADKLAQEAAAYEEQQRLTEDQGRGDREREESARSDFATNLSTFRATANEVITRLHKTVFRGGKTIRPVDEPPSLMTDAQAVRVDEWLCYLEITQGLTEANKHRLTGNDFIAGRKSIITQVGFALDRAARGVVPLAIRKHTDFRVPLVATTLTPNEPTAKEVEATMIHLLRVALSD